MLKALDDEYEAVSASLKVPFYKTFWRVTVPVCLPAILEIARYYFVVSISTLSCVVFLYAPHTIVSAVAIMNMVTSCRTATATPRAARPWTTRTT